MSAALQRIGFTIVRIPCGCLVIDPVDLVRHEIDGIKIVECRWCRATYWWEELRHLTADLPDLSLHCIQHRPLITFGESLLEVVSHHPRGGAVVREYGSPNNVKFQLMVPTDKVKSLTN